MSIETGITKDDLQAITDTGNSNMLTAEELAERFSISRHTVRFRIRNRRWREQVVTGNRLFTKCNGQRQLVPTYGVRRNGKIEKIDLSQRQRGCCGVRNANSSLLPTHVVAIRILAEHGMTQRKIGQIFHITPSSVSYIVRRKTWKHI